ncbi:hypothetical protein B296_00042359, partial [Ensete ventricosum]
MSSGISPKSISIRPLILKEKDYYYFFFFLPPEIRGERCQSALLNLSYCHLRLLLSPISLGTVSSLFVSWKIFVLLACIRISVPITFGLFLNLVRWQGKAATLTKTKLRSSSPLPLLLPLLPLLRLHHLLFCLNPPPELPVPETPESFGNATVAATLSRESTASKEALPPVRLVNRCSSCRKRVGLTGFRCRCGELFCAGHRYSDTHDCSFDYKAAGRESI